MKKVLILAYDFPPYVSVGGLRPYSWYRHLLENDVYPVVVTRQWGNFFGNHLDYVASGETSSVIIEETEFGTIIKTPYKPNLSNRLLLKYGDKKFRLIRKIITGFYEFFQFVLFIGPKVNIYYSAKKYLKKNPVDLIITTGDPFILFKYASSLSKIYNIPWIADYRDPWIQNKKTKRGNLFLKWQSIFEKKYLKNVSLITTVSSFVKSQIESNISGKKFDFITNGYDSLNLEKINLMDQNKSIFSIGFTGTLYKWHPVFQFIETLNDLKSKNTFNFCLNFYGVSGIEDFKSVLQTRYPLLKDNIVFYNKMPNLSLLSELSKNHAFLLFNDYSILGTKIYDYLALKRQIILCFDNDSEALQLKKQHFHVLEFESECRNLQAKLIKETNSGTIVNDKEHLKKVLIDLYNEFSQKGFIACNSNNTEQFSRKIQAQKLAEIIKTVT